MNFLPDGTPTYRHRKLWEWCAIAETLSKAGQLVGGRTGCGFAVGREPLPSLFAARGTAILASDLPIEGDSWAQTGQQVSDHEQVRWSGLISRSAFEQLVRFELVDMRDLRVLGEDRFDFIWSSCALEHLGSLEAGIRFIAETTARLKPGGVAVHTTEYNVSSEENTLQTGWCVIYRKRDIIELSDRLCRMGARLEEPNFDTGSDLADTEPDIPPYYQGQRQHVKLVIDGYIATSILLVITAPP
jgi:SAM-dependent methyltransferase